MHYSVINQVFYCALIKCIIEETYLSNDIMKSSFSGKQSSIVDAIRTEMNSGASFEEAVKVVMKSERFNHMTVKRVAEKLEKDLEITDN